MVMTKYIFVTGGVVSSLGKGISAASVAALLEARGLKVTMTKMDPYINVDPGLMSPFQHGEVFVTDGYGNARIVRYSAKGKFLQTWGKAGNGPGEFNAPHAAVVDRRGRLLEGAAEDEQSLRRRGPVRRGRERQQIGRPHRHP
mgnify:CR=1 FL=1